VQCEVHEEHECADAGPSQRVQAALSESAEEVGAPGAAQ